MSQRFHSFTNMSTMSVNISNTFIQCRITYRRIWAVWAEFMGKNSRSVTNDDIIAHRKDHDIWSWIFSSSLETVTKCGGIKEGIRIPTHLGNSNKLNWYVLMFIYLCDHYSCLQFDSSQLRCVLNTTSRESDFWHNWKIVK
jgi:hypothetical protein